MLANFASIPAWDLIKLLWAFHPTLLVIKFVNMYSETCYTQANTHGVSVISDGRYWGILRKTFYTSADKLQLF